MSTSPNSALHLRNVAHPNRRGLASDFQQHSIALPAMERTHPTASPTTASAHRMVAPAIRWASTTRRLRLLLSIHKIHRCYPWSSSMPATMPHPGSGDFGDGAPSNDAHHPVHTLSPRRCL
ncbi:MAG: hypothetical protein R2795_24910 [Saprospiraceae bacterium]